MNRPASARLGLGGGFGETVRSGARLFIRRQSGAGGGALGVALEREGFGAAQLTRRLRGGSV